MITILTWGQSKRKDYPEVDVIMNCLSLDNPPSVLWSLDGRSMEVRGYIVNQIVRNKTHGTWFDDSERFILKHAKENADFKLGIYCSGGRHRSVSVAEVIAQILRNKKFDVTLTHMELT